MVKDADMERITHFLSRRFSFTRRRKGASEILSSVSRKRVREGDRALRYYREGGGGRDGCLGGGGKEGEGRRESGGVENGG